MHFLSYISNLLLSVKFALPEKVHPVRKTTGMKININNLKKYLDMVENLSYYIIKLNKFKSNKGYYE